MAVEPAVGEYLLDPDLLEADALDPEGLRPEDAAVACTEQLLEHWHETPEAMDWLEEQIDRR